MIINTWALGFILISFLSGLATAGFLWVNARRSRGSDDLVSGRAELAPSDVSVVVPVYQQDPSRFAACLASIATQGARLVVVGDGCLEPYRSMTESWGGEYVALPAPRGKKAAMAEGISHVSSPVVLFLDSDTVVPPEGVVRMLAHLGPGVGGVAANLSVPLSGGWIPHLAEFVERSREVVHRAMSADGSVMLLEGACAMYRTSLVRPFLGSERFRDLRVLGRPVPLGDDWQLTGCVLDAGMRAIKAYDVRAETPVARDFSTFMRQNVRWARSGWIRFGSELRSGTLSRRSRLYRFELMGAYILPLLAFAAMATRIPLLLQHGLYALLPPAVAQLLTHGVAGLAHIRGFLLFSSLPLAAEVVAGSAFLWVATRAMRQRERWRTILVGPLATFLLFGATVYGLATIWKAGRWEASGSVPDPKVLHRSAPLPNQ